MEIEASPEPDFLDVPESPGADRSAGAALLAARGATKVNTEQFVEVLSSVSPEFW